MQIRIQIQMKYTRMKLYTMILTCMMIPTCTTIPICMMIPTCTTIRISMMMAGMEMAQKDIKMTELLQKNE